MAATPTICQRATSCTPWGARSTLFRLIWTGWPLSAAGRALSMACGEERSAGLSSWCPPSGSLIYLPGPLGTYEQVADQLLVLTEAAALTPGGPGITLTCRSTTLRITTKGQVTIPIEIREKLGLLPDTEVEFEIDRDAVRMKKASAARRSHRGRALVDHMRGRGTRRITTDEIMKLTRG